MILLGSLGLAVAAGCGVGAFGEPDVSPTQVAATATLSPPSTEAAPALRAFSFPIAGACLPKGDQLMPNAPRVYRNGIHEGVDFYASDSCTAVGRGTPVLAARGGTVVRADLSYVNMTTAELDRLLADPSTAAALDRFRGRQVWIDHGGGSVSRYAHLDTLATGIDVGARVHQGEVIAYVGESGTPESVTNPGSEYHLHFELRVGDSYFGAALPASAVRALYDQLFSP